MYVRLNLNLVVVKKYSFIFITHGTGALFASPLSYISKKIFGELEKGKSNKSQEIQFAVMNYLGACISVARYDSSKDKL